MLPFPKNNLNNFNLDLYLKNIIFSEDIEPNILNSLLLNLCEVYKNTIEIKDNIKLLMFLLKNRWGIKLRSFSNYFGKNPSYLKMLKQCLEGIESEKTYIFLSLIV